jgi:Lar family restriction alleviation protein
MNTNQTEAGAVLAQSPVRLLPCPFCGLTDKDTVSPDMCQMPAVALHGWGGEHERTTYVVQCEGCGCSGPLHSDSAKAVEQWNTRPNTAVSGLPK